MRHRRFLLWIGLPLLMAAAGCVATLPPTRRVNSALDFLYPQGATTAEPASQVVLKLPVRVGLAFAPNRENREDPITEEQKQRLRFHVSGELRDGLGALRPGGLSHGGFPRSVDPGSGRIGRNALPRQGGVRISRGADVVRRRAARGGPGGRARPPSGRARRSRVSRPQAREAGCPVLVRTDFQKIPFWRIRFRPSTTSFSGTRTYSVSHWLIMKSV